VVLWDAPGIPKESMEAAIETVGTYARKYCGGHVERSEIL
jgi:hypothetical protein